VQKKRKAKRTHAVDEEGELAPSTATGERKVKKRAVAKRKPVRGSGLEAKTVREDECPGMLLMDFVESDTAPVPRKAPLKRRAAAVSSKKKQADRDDVDLGDTDLLFAAGDDEQADGDASARLLTAMGRLATQGDSAGETSAALRHAEEARPESEFHAGAAGEAITVEDLIAPLAETSGFGDIRKQLEGLASKEAMPEPVSEVAKTREERKVQYDQTSKEIGKFLPQVQRMEKADQVVLGEENIHEPKTTAALVGTFTPMDDFEKELEEATRAAGTSEEQLKGSETLPMNPRIRDEKQMRQIAKLKALMLREQQTSKRLKKIKSKTYHRIHRKAESREREVLLERLEHENPELAKTLKQEYEKKYAQMRLQRGRNARKKWTATMQRFAKGDRNAASEISKQAQNAEDEKQALRRAIQGKNPDQSEDSEAVDLSESDSGDDGEGRRKSLAERTVQKAKKLTVRELKDVAKDGELPTTGILGLNFMRDAIIRKRESAKAEAQNVLNELEHLDARLDKDNLEADSDTEGRQGKAKPQEDVSAALKKRRAFTEEELAQAGKEVDEMLGWDDATQTGECSVSGPLTVRGVAAAPAAAAAAAAKQPPSGGSSSSTAAPARKAPGAAVAGAAAGEDVAADSVKATVMGKARPCPPDEENPWLAASPEPEDADAADEEAADADAELPEQKKRPKTLGSKSIKRKRRRKSTEDDQGPQQEGEASVPLSESIQLTSTADLLNILDEDTEAAREQRDLVRTTFVEGTQVEDFEEEQEELQRKKEERDKPEELMGWGHWTGAGTRPRKPRPEPKAAGGKGAAGANSGGSSQRRSHVQKYEGDQDRKAKYFVDKVPYPFQSPQQYDQTLKMPSGPEWHTLPEHLSRVKPKVFTKVGTVVAPLQYVKHLPPEQRDNALQAWAAAKQPKRLKARF